MKDLKRSSCPQCHYDGELSVKQLTGWWGSYKCTNCGYEWEDIYIIEKYFKESKQE